MNKQRFGETTTFDEICIYDMDAFDVARALRRDGINLEDREQVMSYSGRSHRRHGSAFAWQTGIFRVTVSASRAVSTVTQSHGLV